MRNCFKSVILEKYLSVLKYMIFYIYFRLHVYLCIDISIYNLFFVLLSFFATKYLFHIIFSTDFNLVVRFLIKLLFKNFFYDSN